MGKGKVSFDFDGVLDREDIQALASWCIKQGHEVYILTARFADEDPMAVSWRRTWNDDLKAIAAKLGIPKERWLFTGMGDKSPYFLKEQIMLHR